MTTHRPKAEQIFTTGAYCEPRQWTDADGKTQWRWIVVGFEDDSYQDGDYVSPVVSADTRDNLMEEIDEDD